MYKQYKHLVIEDPDDPPTESEIRAIEQKLGSILPPNFIDFLNVANGGSLEDYILTVVHSGQPEVMGFSRIFTTRETSPVSFLAIIEMERNSHYASIPEKVLPFAEDGGGSTLYLDLRESDHSPVMAFIHGLPAWTGSQQPKDQLIKIADSFSEYLDMLEFDFEYPRQLLLEAISANDEKRIAANIEYLDLALPNWREVWGIDTDGLQSSQG
jgi:hypothetical protein